ncbi:Hypothetical protein BN69_2805 [Methylocystis sp. SC2]|nr:Hypothetical protein BN69_2805 [Methylocystis sp. SC2]
MAGTSPAMTRKQCASAAAKSYPFEVALAGAKPSAALADQVKSLDWRARKARRKAQRRRWKWRWRSRRQERCWLS